MKSDFCSVGAVNQATDLYVGIFYTDSGLVFGIHYKIPKISGQA
jgi:hypothetical protein